MILPIGFIGSVLLEFTKKHTKNKKLMLSAFILNNMLFFLIFGLLLGGIMSWLGSAQSDVNGDVFRKFLLMLVCTFPFLGFVHGAVWWLAFTKNGSEKA